MDSHPTRQRLVAVLRDQLGASGQATFETTLEVVRRENEQQLLRGGPTVQNEAAEARAVLNEVTGFGVLQPLLDDPSIEEIWINDDRAVYVARAGVSERLAISITAEDLRSLVERMLAHTSRRVDRSTPFVDASLPDGSRLHVVIPDVTRTHWSVNIRKFRKDVSTLNSLVDRNMLTASAAGFIRDSVRAGLNLIIAGPTHAGKTTLLTAALESASHSERIVSMEETFELALAHHDWVALQCRPANLEGGGEVPLRRLVKESLRMRPDRIVVGEVREAESLDLLIALNSGIPGAATIHANNAVEAIRKLCTLPLLAGANIDSRFVTPTVAAVIDIVVQCRISPEGHRYVSEVSAPNGSVIDGTVQLEQMFVAEWPKDRTPGRPVLRAVGAKIPRPEKFEAADINPLEHLVPVAA